MNSFEGNDPPLFPTVEPPSILGTSLIQGTLECFPERDACCWGLVSRNSVCEGRFLRLLVGPKNLFLKFLFWVTCENLDPLISRHQDGIRHERNVLGAMALSGNEWRRGWESCLTLMVT